MTKSRALTAVFFASALIIAPMSTALAGGQHWSHGPAYRGYHGGGHGSYWHGGGGYWRGGVWWPAAAAAAVVGTAAALVAAPFVAIGNAVASTAYVAPPAPYYPPQQYYAPQRYTAPQQYYPPQGYAAPQQYYPPQGYSAPQQYYAPQSAQLYYAAPSGSAPQSAAGVPPDYYAQRAPQQYYAPQRSSAPQQYWRSADCATALRASNVACAIRCRGSAGLLCGRACSSAGSARIARAPGGRPSRSVRAARRADPDAATSCSIAMALVRRASRPLRSASASPSARSITDFRTKGRCSLLSSIASSSVCGRLPAFR